MVRGSERSSAWTMGTRWMKTSIVKAQMGKVSEFRKSIWPLFHET